MEIGPRRLEKLRRIRSRGLLQQHMEPRNAPQGPQFHTLRTLTMLGVEQAKEGVITDGG